MRAFDRRWALAYLAVMLAVGSGCDLQTIAYFMMPEAREEAIIKHLASEDKKKDPHVMILTYTNGLETRAEFIQADRQLAEMLAGHLRKMAEADQQKLTIIPQNKVETFKNTHPNWHQMDNYQIGRALGADYVIYLEIGSMSLYEKNSYPPFLRGRANIDVTLTEVAKPDEPQSPCPMTCVYPSEARGGISSFDANEAQFRRDFLNQVAKELSWHFSRHPKRDRQVVDGPSL